MKFAHGEPHRRTKDKGGTNEEDREGAVAGTSSPEENRRFESSGVRGWIPFPCFMLLPVNGTTKAKACVTWLRQKKRNDIAPIEREI